MTRGPWQSVSITNVIAFALIGLIALAGVVLAYLGLRGRVVGGEPRCRRCGFDLRGNPDAANCGECGADLKRLGAMRHGRRVRRPRFVVAGVTLLLPALLVGGGVGYVAYRGVAWVRYAPAWYLLRDAESAPPADTAALGELVRRQTSGDLSDASLPRLVQVILDRQADRAIPWDQTLGGVVETAWAGGKLSDAAKADYLLNGFGLRLEARPDVRQGDVLPMKFDYDFRFGGVTNFQMYAEPLELRLGDEVIEVPPRLGGGAETHGTGGSWMSNAASVPSAQTDKWDAGVYELAATVRLTAGPAGANPDTPDGPDLPEVTLNRTLALTVPVRVRPRVEPENLFTIDPAVGAKIDALARVSPLGPSSKPFTPVPRAIWIGLPDAGAFPPFDYQVVVRTADGDVTLGADTIGGFTDPLPDGTAIEAKVYQLGDLPPGTADAGRVTLVLRPDADAARLRTDGRKPWGREIVFPNVPVTGEEVSFSVWYGTDGQKK